MAANSSIKSTTPWWGYTWNSAKNYFTPHRSYCVETICAPCGVVIAWAKFAKSESPTNFLNLLQTVYSTEESWPDYICIDKACGVLHHIITEGDLDAWGKTTWFIVDTYHYTNHCVMDFMCWKWCNPAPMDGSAPNLVIVEHDKDGIPYYKCAFNTHMWATQCMAWRVWYNFERNDCGKFQLVLHAMLSYHSWMVMNKQQQDPNNDIISDDESDM